MERILSLEDLSQAKKQAQERLEANAAQCHFVVRVSAASCGVAAGALNVLQIFQDFLADPAQADSSKKICVIPIGCLGLCSLEPVVQVQQADRVQITYGRVNRAVARKIIQQHILQGRIVQENVIELM